MRLLLDEHYSTEIAEGLRDLGHDALTVAEAGLRGAGDEELLRFATVERPALLTNNARHFAPLARRLAAGAESHAGIVFSSDSSMPRGKGTVGRYIEALSALMGAHPEDESFRDRTAWLDA